MPEPIKSVQTLQYNLYITETISEGLRAVFATHPDRILREKTSVVTDFSFKKTEFPAVVIRFYERSIATAGIGHFELLEDPNNPGAFQKHKHMLYQGDLEFAIYALSSYDRALISDSIVQTVMMGDLEPYSELFYDRIYSVDPVEKPQSLLHFINLNSDQMAGFGKTQQPAPWQPEDVYIYQNSYRVGIHGEFYSRVLPYQSYGLIEKVETFPYMPAAGETEPDPDWAGPDDVRGTADDKPDPAPWVSE
jgi:hypothetical protein